MSHTEIKSLKIKRGNAKSKLTRFEKFLNEFDATNQYPVLEKYSAELDAARTSFEKIHFELQLLSDDTDELESYQTEFEEKYMELYAISSNLLNKRASISSQSDTPRDIDSLTSNGSTNVISHAANLPKITLPTFTGSFESWLGFHDLFNSLVNEDSRIPPIQKLFYLRGCLAGEAAEVIAAIELSADNYQVAWNLLKERYDNRKFIRQSHTKALLNMPCISKEFTVRVFLDCFQKHFRALKSLGEPVESWDTLLITIILEKFNYYLREKWEDFSNDFPKPTIDQMISFLQRRSQLEDNKSYQGANKRQQSVEKRISQNPRQNIRHQQSYSAATTVICCPHCGSDHSIKNCEKFTSLAPAARYESAKRASLCINCLRKGHRATECSAGKCRKCNQKHNTLLHFNNTQANQRTQVNSDGAAVHLGNPSSLNLHASVKSETLLATAIVDIVNQKGKTKACRVFLDAGSQAHFITEATAKFLDLDRKSVNISVTGVDDISTHVRHSSSATIRSKFSKFEKNIEFLIVPQITKAMPSIHINRGNLEIPKNIQLADPKFEQPSNIDALIGVKLFYKLLCIGQISLKNHPNAILQKTQLGWIIAGEINHAVRANNIYCHISVTSNPSDTNLTRFWEIEELPDERVYSAEESLAEDHFVANTQRDTEGRYIVRLPFNHNKSKLGTSHHLAVKRFHCLEHRLAKDSILKREYSEFLEEYRNLKHMSKCVKHDTRSGFYLPHHAVVKQQSLTTKLRVVFDGSAKSTSGISLNDALMVGPKIQEDLFSILTRFRSHKYALTADIEKMYRQVRVHPDDVCYQKILYRDGPGDDIDEYTLDTVTYGTACASFLAIRALQQLAKDEGDRYPIAAAVLKRDFYVDDLLTGASSRNEAKILRDDLLALLKMGNFHLRKWASNDPTLIPDPLKMQNSTHLALDLDSTVKTLGLQWNSRKDKIFYSVNISGYPKVYTKRTILSQIAKLFDPLGLLGPVILYAKIIIQLLWKAGVAWDESIPLEIHTLWSTYQEQLHLIKSIQFERFILAPRATNIQLHGFCDASEKAYGACIYIRSVDDIGKITVQLVCSKSRVAPVKSLSLPRLELCGTLLLSRLFTVVNKALSLSFDSIYLWSDSTIALSWINTEPHLLKTFVANRVSEIRRLTASCHWSHVASGENPADLVSRGQTPYNFTQTRIWQNGPIWLGLESDTWPKGKFTISELPEMKPLFISKVCMKIELSNNEALLEKYSSLPKLRRIIAYIFRFIFNSKNPSNRNIGQLSKSELDKAHKTILRATQAAGFMKEITLLTNNENIDEKSRLVPLNPFIDDEGILRVGGRLSHASIPAEQRHPILLPSDHAITRLIIREEHLRLKHAGAQSTLYSVRQRYWPLNGRNITRKIIHQCIPCFRVKPRHTDHSMGLLPGHRVTASRPFLNVGVDYCGPFYIKERRFRNRNKLKVYVAVYVCLSTKAVHLELVSDLTTDAFIASLKRLFSRRGKSAAIYSDNASNFVGAKNELNALHNLFTSDKHNKALQRYCEDEQISWHFIPPKSPHFGGIWEAAVKSFKYHLLRTVGNTLLTYEQLETFIIEIEAILNSRPLSPMSSDPNDLIPLTPGHLLIGSSLTSFPQEDLTSVSSNRLSAWQHAQHLKQHFWQRWYKEYLNHLICFAKRLPDGNCIQVGTLVLIKEDHLPPLHWSLGRVIATHPGEDNVIRVVTLRTKTGEYKRCVKKLCPLPLEN